MFQDLYSLFIFIVIHNKLKIIKSVVKDKMLCVQLQSNVSAEYK